MKGLPLKVFLSVMLLSSASAFAGAKEDFVDAVAKQCSIAKEKAEELATPGRAGNVVKFTLCAEATVDLGNGCKVTCSQSGSTIGK